MPAVRGVIERRILVNFRCPPEILNAILPSPFHAKIIRGSGIAGICLIRLTQVRPAFVPVHLGFRSENAAHRIAVVWDDAGREREGVFIPRRDTDSWLNQVAGGTVFPGAHHAASFTVWETGGNYKLEMRSADGTTFLRIRARAADKLPSNSIFRSLAEASAFLRNGALGWSVRATDEAFDGLELDCNGWRIEPLAVDRLESSYFENTSLFPAGTVEFDSAFLMRNVSHEWHARGILSNNNTEAA